VKYQIYWVTGHLDIGHFSISSSLIFLTQARRIAVAFGSDEDFVHGVSFQQD
jgi:hypothetical protein